VSVPAFQFEPDQMLNTKSSALELKPLPLSGSFESRPVDPAAEGRAFVHRRPRRRAERSAELRRKRWRELRPPLIGQTVEPAAVGRRRPPSPGQRRRREKHKPASSKRPARPGHRLNSILHPPPVTPNPSFEARPNGKPPGPGHRYAVHYLWPGPGVLPSVPPQLER